MTRSPTGGRVVVVGSINLDTTFEVARLPAGGETVMAGAVRTAVGGKGANQAAASALQGVPTALVAGVGDDGAGRTLLDALAASGVDVGGCKVVAATPSGQAFIAVDAGGANSIVVAAGANARLTADDVPTLDARVVLTQLEIGDGPVRAALAQARAVGAFTILNPAPARPLDPAILMLCDLLVPNEHEATALTGCASPREAAASLAASAGGASVIVTCGDRGAVGWRAGDWFEVPPFPVDVVDTVAAGDAYCGVLAAAIAEGCPLEESARRASAAGALATTVRGALTSLPSRADVDALLDRGPNQAGLHPWR
jgi:ribokinase